MKPQLGAVSSRLIAITLGVAILYALMVHVGAYFIFETGFSSPFWPAAGVATVAFIWFGRDAVPGVLIGILYVIVNTSSHADEAATLMAKTFFWVVYLIGLLFQAALSAHFFRRFSHYPQLSVKLKPVVLTLLFSGPVAAVVGASCVTAAAEILSWYGTIIIPIDWFKWWLGDSAGIVCVITPCLGLMLVGKHCNLKHGVEIGIPFVLLMVLTLYAFEQTLRAEQQQLFNQFTLKADQIADQIELQLELHLSELESVSRFYASSNEVDPDEFRQFTAPLVKPSSVTAFAWAPVIHASELDTMQAKLNHYGLNISLPQDLQDEFSIPIVYITTNRESQIQRGTDLNSNTITQVLLRQVMTTKEVGISEPLAFSTSPNQKRALLAAIAVPTTTLPTEEPLTFANVRGFILALYDTNAIIQEALKGFSTFRVSLYEHTEAQLPFYVSDNTTPTAQQDVFSLKRVITAGNRSWFIHIETPDGITPDQINWMAWMTLVFGSLFAGTLTLMQGMVINRSMVIQQLAHEQNKDIKVQREKISQQNLLIRYMLESSPLGFLICDPIGDVILYCNAKYFDMFGIPDPDERQEGVVLSMEKYQQQIMPYLKEPELYKKNAAYLFDPSHRESIDGTISLKNGRILRCLSQQIRNEDDQYIGRIYIYDDITEDHKMRDELHHALREAKAATKAKSAFLANMSHELRTPMNGVIGMTSLLQSTELNERQRNFLDTLKNSGESLLALINDILDFSKIEAGKINLETITFSPWDTMEDALNITKSRAREKDLEIHLEITPNTPRRVIGDPNRFRQIALNLLSNAIKFTETGDITITLDAKPYPPRHQQLTLTVEDTGIGISEDQMPHLFEAFTQADASITRRFGGTGLGLALTKQIIEAMQGDITITSKLGKGSRFTATVRMETPNEEHVLVNLSFPELDNCRLILIGEQSKGADMLTRQLAYANLNLEIVNSLPDASHIARHEQHDVILFAYEEQLHPIPPLLASFHGEHTRLILIENPHHETVDLSHLDFPVYRLEWPLLPSKLYYVLTSLHADTAINRSPSGTNTSAQPQTNQLLDKRILIAEDNRVNQEVIVALLEQYNCKITLANNGNQAVSAWQNQSFDLILMDCLMPELSGFDATKQIRQLEKTTGHRTPIIAVTANALKGDEEKCLASGMDGYVSKPIDAERLVETMERWLG